MSDEKYYLIYNSDGDVHILEMTKEQLQKYFDEQQEYKEESRAQFLEKMPEDSDTNYWGGKELIIKGKIVTPKAKEVVTKMEIE